MRFEYEVSVDVDRVTGKFASRHEINDVIREAVDSALSDLDLSGLGADGESEYEATDYSVDDVEVKTTRSAKPKRCSECAAEPDEQHDTRCSKQPGGSQVAVAT